ncbi:hypothetical protein C8R44DRAFT_740147 [Mycena epipterygia]|nr:hypothetical protein C8R44DRAFT_740147 [Mycena epipterygia]
MIGHNNNELFLLERGRHEGSGSMAVEQLSDTQIPDTVELDSIIDLEVDTDHDDSDAKKLAAGHFSWEKLWRWFFELFEQIRIWLCLSTTVPAANTLHTARKAVMERERGENTDRFEKSTLTKLIYRVKHQDNGVSAFALWVPFSDMAHRYGLHVQAAIESPYLGPGSEVRTGTMISLNELSRGPLKYLERRSSADKSIASLRRIPSREDIRARKPRSWGEIHDAKRRNCVRGDREIQEKLEAPIRSTLKAPRMNRYREWEFIDEVAVWFKAREFATVDDR